jgi:hypothetical protein
MTASVGVSIPPATRAVRLQTSRDCRRLLAKVINQQVKGSLEDSKAKTTAYLVSILLKAIADDVTEERLSEIERKLNEYEREKKY